MTAEDERHVVEAVDLWNETNRTEDDKSCSNRWSTETREASLHGQVPHASAMRQTVKYQLVQ